MDFLANYGLFLVKLISLVVAVLVVVAAIAAIASRNKEKEQGKLIITKLNKKFEEMTDSVNQEILSKEEAKTAKKAKKIALKQAKSKIKKINRRIFVLNFQGDIRASAVATLREEITAILLSIKPGDEVLLKLESPGGMVNAYGLAASQLQRLREAKVKLTIAVDKVAASGGYMMACVADHIIAAPFSIVGSIGVITQLPNFHRFLKKHNIDFEQITAGQFKRTLSLFGENTEKGRLKAQDEVEDVHELFKSFIQAHRPQVPIEEAATGEYWFAAKALDLRLIDELKTSDDYLLQMKDNFDIYEIQYKIKKSLGKRFSVGFANLLSSYTQPSSFPK